MLAISVAGCASMRARQPSPTPLPVVPDLGGVTAEGRLEPVRYVDLATNTDGQVKEVLGKEGEDIAAGEVIATIDSRQARSLDAAEAGVALDLGNAYQAVRTAQRAFDEYPVPRIFIGLSPEQAAEAWLAELQAARAAFAPYEDTSRKTLKPNHFFPHLPRRVVLDTGEYEGVAKEYKKRVDVAWANYTKAIQWLTLASALESAEADLQVAQSRFDSLQDASMSESTAGTRAALANAEVRAPYAGKITNFDLKPGQSVSAGQSVATIADFTNWVVKTTNLTEIDVISIRNGQAVHVTIDALPGLELDGRVTSIAQNYSERQGDIVYTATIVLGEVDPAMRWGMTAQVDFGE
jgi:multidrug resistance efflux pump